MLPDCIPQHTLLETTMRALGDNIAWDSLTIKQLNVTAWHFVAVAHCKTQGSPLPDIYRTRVGLADVNSSSLSYSRN